MKLTRIDRRKGFTMSLLVSLYLLQAAVASPASANKAESPPTKATKVCRDVLVSSSRVRPIRVCKTKAAWQRWERCHSATRYCAPPRKSTVTVASLPNDKLICKFIKETGSRIGQQKVCATKREWELVELETQETIRNRQSTSTLASESPPPPGPGGGGPR